MTNYYEIFVLKTWDPRGKAERKIFARDPSINYVTVILILADKFEDQDSETEMGPTGRDTNP